MNTATLQKTALYIFYGLLAYMPLHIFVSTWIGTSWYILPFAKVAKDIVLLLGFFCALVAAYRSEWFRGLYKQRLVQLIAAYAAITVLVALLRPTDQDAEVLGVVYNLRLFVMFLYAAMLSQLFSVKKLVSQSVKIVLAMGLLVAAFGVVQYTLLPDEALTGVGYSRQNGVLPAFFIDDKPDLERVMSTLRDPNSLGSYLLIIISLSTVLLAKYWQNQDIRKVLLGALALSLLSLVFTFSRSAWLGLLVVAGVYLLSYPKKIVVSKKAVYAIIAVSTVLTLALLGLFTFAGNSYVVQNVIFHADQSTTLEDPNQLRIRFLQESVEDIAQQPLGGGPGTAGLASIKNDKQGTILNENYYLQIATEVGIIGLLLFLAILYLVAKQLWLQRSNPVALALLVSLAGLCVTNMLVHIWSNEAVAYTWWGLAGLLFVPKAGKQQTNK